MAEHEIHTEVDRDYEAGRKGGAVAAAYPTAARYGGRAVTESEIGEAVYLGFSRTAWPAIWAGFFVGTMTYILLSVLGAALGVSWVSDDQVAPGAFRTAAGVYMIFTLLVSYFVGGLITGRMSGLPGKGTGAMNGFLYGCFAFILFAVFAITPMMAAIPNVTQLFGMMGGGMPNIPNPNMPNANQAMDTAQAALWWSFFGLLVALGAATLGGMCGARSADVDPLTTGQAPEHRDHH